MKDCLQDTHQDILLTRVCHFVLFSKPAATLPSLPPLLPLPVAATRFSTLSAAARSQLAATTTLLRRTPVLRKKPRPR